MKRYLVIIAAVVIQTCLGGVYAWSGLSVPLEQHYGVSARQVQAVFGTCIFVFTASVVVSGRLADRFGFRPVACAGGLLVGAGYVLSGLSGGQLYLIRLGMGVLTGVGIGCGYVCAIAAAVRWFPRHKGLVTGLAVAGYGAGAIVLSGVEAALLKAGWDVMEILRAVGGLYGLAVLVGGLMLFAPPKAAARRGDFRYGRVLRCGQFWQLACGMFCSTMPGLMILGSLKPIGISFGLDGLTASSAIAFMAVGNSSGRLIWGMAYDRLGGTRTIAVSMLAVIVSVLAVLAAGGWGAGFLAAVALAGFCYGGCFAVYAPRAAELYGPEVLASVYPLIMLAHGLAALAGSTIAGHGLSLAESYRPGLWAALIFAVAGLALYVANQSRKAAPGRAGD